MRQQNYYKISNIQEIKKSKSSCCGCFCYCMRWFFSILIWISIVGIIILKDSKKKDIRIALIITLSISYAIYLGLIFVSPTFHLIGSKSKSKLDTIMSQFFKSVPTIKFQYVRAYYNRYKTTSKDFPIYNCKDISENWIVSKEEIKRKYFMSFSIISEIYMKDQDTINEYERQRDKFMATVNSSNVKTTINYQNLNNKYIICLKKKKCGCFLNCGIYFLFSILTFEEIYALVLNILTLEKTFTVKKEISAGNEFGQFLRQNVIDTQTGDENGAQNGYNFYNSSIAFHLDNKEKQ